MNTLAKADIFFFITSLAVVAIAMVCIVVLVYLARIMKNIKDISDAAHREARGIADDIHAFREDVVKEGTQAIIKTMKRMHHKEK